MSKCDTCGDIFPFAALSRIAERSVNYHEQINERRPSMLMHQAFRNKYPNGDGTSLSCVLENAVYDPSQGSSNTQLIPTASSYYYVRQPNCLSVALHSGMRGAVVGGVFGGAMGLSTATQSGFRGSAVLTRAGQNAARNAVAFSSWTATYGLTKCALARVRGRDDVINAAVAGFLTGGVLTLATTGRQWRYHQQTILSNAAGSAMVAVMFQALNQM